MVPRPAKAVIIVFPYEEGKPRLKAENEAILKEGWSKVDGSVFWMKQTVRYTTFELVIMPPTERVLE